MNSQEEIISKIEAIDKRNKIVEADKAWELSLCRRLFISGATYLTAAIWLELINDTYPWLKAFVPTVAYLLSTLSLPTIKRKWISKQLINLN